MLHSFDRPVLLRRLAQYPNLVADRVIDSHPGVAALLFESGLDADNPLGPWIQPGMRVLVKPNWVRHAADGWAAMEALTTHPSVIRPIVEYTARALRTKSGRYEGEIILADAPLQSTDFDRLLTQSALLPLMESWRGQGIPISVADLRCVISDTDESTGIVSSSRIVQGDPRGNTVVDLGMGSRLESLLAAGGRVGVSNYDCDTTTMHHCQGIHRYRIANSLLDCDVVINLPKWKTHVKTGVTGALKNFIGINCDKAYLPHFRVGSPRRGGDEYPDSFTGALLARMRPWLERVMPGGVIRTARKSLFSSVQRSGSPLIFGGAWPGNDTLWRTVHDMVFIARWLGKDGAKLSSPRPILTVLDAIVAGEGDGPLRPLPRDLNCLLFGTDPGQIDIHASALSGFDWRAIPLLTNLTGIEAASITRFDADSLLPETEMKLKPPQAWAKALSAKDIYHEAA